MIDAEVAAECRRMMLDRLREHATPTLREMRKVGPLVAARGGKKTRRRFDAMVAALEANLSESWGIITAAVLPTLPASVAAVLDATRPTLAELE